MKRFFRLTASWGVASVAALALSGAVSAQQPLPVLPPAHEPVLTVPAEALPTPVPSVPMLGNVTAVPTTTPVVQEGVPAPLEATATEAAAEADPKKDAPKKDEPKKDEKKDEKKEEKKEEEPCKCPNGTISLCESWHNKSFWDSLHPEKGSSKKWYDKLSIRGYTQIRQARTLTKNNVTPQLLGDSNVNNITENFTLRRVRLILSGDVGEHLGLYIQPDFAVTPEGSTRNTFFTQLRDCYGDIYLTKDKIHRVRAGLSKVPYGFENLQSSQNRLALDRTEPINLMVNPNERDLGLFYYWTPEDKQKLFKDLVDCGLKGSGNYGIFGIGVYNGQGGSQLEFNRNLHAVTRLTYPFLLENGQCIEASVQARIGEYTVTGSALRPLGRGNTAITPAGTLQSTIPNRNGIQERTAAVSFIYYPQPLGFQCEWQVGDGPGLSADQRTVQQRNLNGGYVQMMYRWDTCTCGIFIPFVRYQNYLGGYRSQANAPYGRTQITEIGVEWQIWKEVELVCEYSIVDKLNTTTVNAANVNNYQNFEGNVIRVQLQINY